MAKTADFPALRMTVVAGGRLAPATAFDQERLDSYRVGSTVYVKFTEDNNRVGIKKWFAVLNLALKQCGGLPWKNREEAHEAIKLALGIVTLGKSQHGNYIQWPKSLNDLDDPELDEAFEQMVALLSRMTGVDVTTLRREAANVGREEAKDAPKAETPAANENAPHPPSTAGHTYNEPVRVKLIEFAQKALRLAGEDITVNERNTILGGMEIRWRDVIPEEHWAKLGSVVKAARAVINGMRTRTEAVAFITEVLECTPADLEAPKRKKQGVPA